MAPPGVPAYPSKVSTSRTTRRRASRRLSARWLRIVRGYTTVLVGSAIARAFSFLATVIVARALGPSDFGDFSIFFALLVIFSMTGDFIDITYVRRVNDPDVSEPQAYLRGVVVLKGLLFLLLLVLAYPLAYLLSHLVFERPSLWPAIFVAVVCGSGISFISLRAATFLAREQMGRFSVTSSLFYVLILVVLLPIFFGDVHLSLATLYVLFLATSLGVGLLSFSSLVRSARPMRLETPVVREILTFAKWLLASNLVLVVYQRMDIVLLARYVPKAEIGHYGAALRLTVVATLTIAALSGFLLPKIARTRASREHLVSYFHEGLLLAAGLVASIGVLWLATPFLVTTLFGDEFAPAAHLARIILIGTALLAVSVPIGQLLLADDVPRQVLYNGLVRMGAIFFATILLAPRFGAEGAAWATVSAEALALVYSAAIIWRRWRTRYAAMPIRDAEQEVELARE